MKSDLFLRRSARVSLVLFFFVILAGSIVRTTGSGMGCPDWPKCFGYLVPPVSIDPLLFQPDHAYEAGQMVVRHDTLWVARAPFTSGDTFNGADWLKYPKHDYATFNALQTWIEYINRLATAVFAIPVLVMAFLAFRRWRRTGDTATMALATGAVIFIGFEAWLGKLVVDGNLKTSSITLHMIGSLVIILCIIGVLNRIRVAEQPGPDDRQLPGLAWMGVALAIVQILLGTQVREEIDVAAVATDDRSLWVGMLGWIFYIHRSFSLLVIAIAGYTWYRLRQGAHRSWGNALLVLVGMEVLAGVVLAYLDMPAFMQPLHLLFAVMWFALAVQLVILSRVQIHKAK
ncbi:MAG: COX15/CtaA family protein [Flavobacteriales bacterium]|jgi:cytochrome c oxidase assembly protein subunit 15